MADVMCKRITISQATTCPAQKYTGESAIALTGALWLQQAPWHRQAPPGSIVSKRNAFDQSCHLKLWHMVVA